MNRSQYEAWWRRLSEETNEEVPSPENGPKRGSSTIPVTTTTTATPFIPAKIEVRIEDQAVTISAETAAGLSAASGLGTMVLCVVLFYFVFQ